MKNLVIDRLTAFGDHTKANCEFILVVGQQPRCDSLTLRNVIGCWGGSYYGWRTDYGYGHGAYIVSSGSSSATKCFIHDPENRMSSNGVNNAYSSSMFTKDTTANATNLVQDYANGNFRVVPALVNAGANGVTRGANIDDVLMLTAGCATGVWS